MSPEGGSKKLEYTPGTGRADELSAGVICLLHANYWAKIIALLWLLVGASSVMTTFQGEDQRLGGEIGSFDLVLGRFNNQTGKLVCWEIVSLGFLQWAGNR